MGGLGGENALSNSLHAADDVLQLLPLAEADAYCPVATEIA